MNLDEKTLIKGDLATYKHISDVKNNIFIFIHELLNRAKNHDLSKFESPEREIFAENLEELGNTTYGSDKYKELLNKTKIAIDIHYTKNKHHPEYFKDGINGMNLIDLIELLCDWFSATKRHKDGNIYKSIEYNEKRFNISSQLKKILENTVKDYFS